MVEHGVQEIEQLSGLIRACIVDAAAIGEIEHHWAANQVGCSWNRMWTDSRMRSKGTSISVPMRLTTVSLGALKRKSAIPSAGTRMQPKDPTARPGDGLRPRRTIRSRDTLASASEIRGQ
jgi:hypothetical protein